VHPQCLQCAALHATPHDATRCHTHRIQCRCTAQTAMRYSFPCTLSRLSAPQCARDPPKLTTATTFKTSASSPADAVLLSLASSRAPCWRLADGPSLAPVAMPSTASASTTPRQGLVQAGLGPGMRTRHRLLPA